MLPEIREWKNRRKDLEERIREVYERDLFPLSLENLGIEDFPMVKQTKEEFRRNVEKYAREHPEEKVEGEAIDKDNLTYRGLRIEKKR